MGLQSDDRLLTDGTILAGPYHPSFGERVYSRAFYLLAEAVLKKHSPDPNGLTIYVHPHNYSKMIGAGRENLNRLKSTLNIKQLSIRPNPHVTPHHLEVDNPSARNASR